MYVEALMFNCVLKVIKAKWGFPGSSDSKKSACYAGELGLIPGSGEWVPGEGNGNPLQCSCLVNPMDRGAWWVTVHKVTEADTTE